MSTLPPGRTPAPRDPLKLLSAILTGLVLGFFAVLFAQRMLPRQEQDQMVARTDAASRQPMDKPRAATVPAAKLAAPVRHAEMAPLPASKPAPEESKRPAKDNSPAPATLVSGKPETASETPKPAAAGAAQQSKAGSEPAKPSAAEAAQAAKAEPAAVPALVPASTARPGKALPAEEMTAALQPLLSFKIAGEDAKAVKEAFEASAREDSDDARAAIKKIADPSARNFADWKRLRQSQADLQEGIAFRLAHPLYPDLPQDGANEKALFLSNAPAAAVLKFYVNRQPLSGAGHASLGGALLETGERERGLAMIRFAWGRYVLDPAVEEKFRSRFGALLNERPPPPRTAPQGARRVEGRSGQGFGGARRGLRAAMRARGRARRGRIAPHKVMHRYRGRRADAGDGLLLLREAAATGKARAFRVASLVEPVRYRYRRPAAASEDKDDGKKAPDKGAGTLQSKAAANAFKLAKEVLADPGPCLPGSRRCAARTRTTICGRSCVRSTPMPPIWPPRMFGGSSGVARSAARCSRTTPGPPMPIAKAHGPLEGENLSEAEFTAGWIALRFVHDPLLAVHHFEASRVAGFSPRRGQGRLLAGPREAGGWRVQGGAALFRGGREPVLYLLWRACAPGGSAGQRLRVPGSRGAVARARLKPS